MPPTISRRASDSLGMYKPETSIARNHFGSGRPAQIHKANKKESSGSIVVHGIREALGAPFLVNTTYILSGDPLRWLTPLKAEISSFSAGYQP